MLVEIGKKTIGKLNAGRNIVNSCKLVKTIVSPGKKTMASNGGSRSSKLRPELV